jgi:hypothetical protein
MDDAMEDDEDDEFGDFAAAADLVCSGAGDWYCLLLWHHMYLDL